NDGPACEAAGGVEAAVEAAGAFGPQLALRNCCQVIPPSVLADCAALYLVLHSCIVNAAAGCVAFGAISSAMLVTQVPTEQYRMFTSSKQAQQKPTTCAAAGAGAYRGLRWRLGTGLLEQDARKPGFLRGITRHRRYLRTGSKPSNFPPHGHLGSGARILP